MDSLDIELWRVCKAVVVTYFKVMTCAFFWRDRWKTTENEFQESGSLNSNSALLFFLPVQPSVLLSLLLSSFPFRSLFYLPSTFNLKTSYRILTVWIFWGTRRSVVGRGTALLQVGRSQVRFPMVSLQFFTDTILPAALWPWDWLSL